MFEPTKELPHWRLILREIAIPVPPTIRSRLPPGERCPLVGRGCGSICRYNIHVTPDAGHYWEQHLPDGTVVKHLIETAKGHIDGRCLTKMEALRKPAHV